MDAVECDGAVAVRSQQRDRKVAGGGKGSRGGIDFEESGELRGGMIGPDDARQGGLHIVLDCGANGVDGVRAVNDRHERGQDGGQGRRLLGTGGAIVFKGNGFYATDYRSDSYKKAAEADKPAGQDKSPTDAEAD